MIQSDGQHRNAFYPISNIREINIPTSCFLEKESFFLYPSMVDNRMSKDQMIEFYKRINKMIIDPIKIVPRKLFFVSLTILIFCSSIDVGESKAERSNLKPGETYSHTPDFIYFLGLVQYLCFMFIFVILFLCRVCKIKKKVQTYLNEVNSELAERDLKWSYNKKGYFTLSLNYKPAPEEGEPQPTVIRFHYSQEQKKYEISAYEPEHTDERLFKEDLERFNNKMNTAIKESTSKTSRITCQTLVVFLVSYIGLILVLTFVPDDTGVLTGILFTVFFLALFYYVDKKGLELRQCVPSLYIRNAIKEETEKFNAMGLRWFCDSNSHYWLDLWLIYRYHDIEMNPMNEENKENDTEFFEPLDLGDEEPLNYISGKMVNLWS